MKISVICVTENRTEFMPWLAFVYNSQTYQDKQLIVIDSSPERVLVENQKILEALIPPGELIFYSYEPTGCVIAEKRNVGLNVVETPLLTWLDDDDWKAPTAIEKAVEALAGNYYDVVSVRLKFPFINIHNMQCRYVPTFMWSLGVYRHDAVKGIKFQVKGPRGHAHLTGEDTAWQGDVWEKIPQSDQTRLLEGTSWLGCGLTHTKNIANGVWKPLFWKYPVPTPPDSVSPAEWLLVLQEIRALRNRLGIVSEKEE